MTQKSNKAPIDLIKIIGILWKEKKQYFIVLPITLIVTYRLTLCVPRYYTCKLELAPEGKGTVGSGSLSTLASSFGLDGLSKMAGNDDAISLMLYPNLLKSPSFLVTLFPVHVSTKDGKIRTNYYHYMADCQKEALWNRYIVSPIVNLFVDKKPSSFKGTEHVDVKTMSKKQQEVIKRISSSISCSVDKKNDVITLVVTDQDPVVCATIGDSVMCRIQTFIIDYRTKKARNDYAYFQKLCNEAKVRYEKSRQLYSSMSDANTDVTLQSVQSKINDLENDMQLQYNTYSTLAAQALAAQAKIQEKTPVFTPISTAVIPVRPTGPKRSLIALAITMLVAIILSGKILVKNYNR